ncbi:Similar to putative C-type U1 snRNP [Chondrus crispus]|uniref:Similar to putative C-type U1 snRNP n=1 Tax=Chondrus crispus TaxID=2769 RepID=R7Q753_CHOCR|nr:Similar to putative C-type U1 snRNP [Chondrus crispus]CDF33300.1 Similar to putative C-type U1 snRNP [Chondrus crispus]|eukprot:XP_005713103.1 Similar to putative C-type U1 snRNP [Chondrus crispus]
MGKCYCDYCDVFLTNDSVAVRKQHNDGNRHKYNVCEYYRQYIGQQLQEQIDLIVHHFEQRVASGLLMPSYALPTPKIVSQPQNELDANKQNAREEEAKKESGNVEGTNQTLRNNDGPASAPLSSQNMSASPVAAAAPQS